MDCTYGPRSAFPAHLRGAAGQAAPVLQITPPQIHQQPRPGSPLATDASGCKQSNQRLVPAEGCAAQTAREAPTAARLAVTKAPHRLRMALGRERVERPVEGPAWVLFALGLLAFAAPGAVWAPGVALSGPGSPTRVRRDLNTKTAGPQHPETFCTHKPHVQWPTGPRECGGCTELWGPVGLGEGPVPRGAQ